MLQEWINNALAALPQADDGLFENVWDKQRLLFDGRQGIGDKVDYYSSRLVVATLVSDGQSLITLPDFQPHRPAFLFAIAMIHHVLNSYRSVNAMVTRHGPVLYFGSTIGIREQLRRTSILKMRMNLADVFSQYDVSRGAVELGCSKSSTPGAMPHVVTIYDPADPVSIVREYKPRWIAVDYDDAGSLIWLKPLLEEAARLRIPIVAWGYNPLSECISDFASRFHTFTWPPSIHERGCSFRKLDHYADNLLSSINSISLSPLVIQGKSIASFITLLNEAYNLLCGVTKKLDSIGCLGKDALAVHWKYFRSLESLAVPIDFYEAEAQRFWGLQSFDKLATVCERFRNACLQSNILLFHDLEKIGVLLKKAKHDVENSGCALWEALTNICIEDPPSDEVRILVFASASRKRLFLFALLARHNITEDDLREMRTHVLTLKDLRRLMYSHINSSKTGDDGILMPSLSSIWHPVLVGLPNPSMTPRLLYAFLFPKVDIVLYPHQCPIFMRRQADWSLHLSGDIKNNINCLVHLTEPLNSHIDPIPQGRITIQQPVEINIETSGKTKTSLNDSMWQPADPVSEIANLFHSDDEFNEELVLNDRTEAGASLTTGSDEEILCEGAVKVQFDQGWHAYFASDDVINIIQNGKLDLRYVNSLRVGNQILLIHGQQRQSLYDLIISRVHKHPSIELHLAMIRRWQEDLRVAFEHWHTHIGDSTEQHVYGDRDLNGLLRRMQAQGSQLVSSLTLNFWLRGLVLCPLDPEDLRRVAELLVMNFVRQYYKHIGQAATRLRGLHRGLSIKLNHWLQIHATGAVNKNDNDLIDAELGLTFGDVRNSLLVLRVVGIDNVIGPLLRSNIGRIEKDM